MTRNYKRKTDDSTIAAARTLGYSDSKATDGLGHNNPFTERRYVEAYNYGFDLFIFEKLVADPEPEPILSTGEIA